MSYDFPDPTLSHLPADTSVPLLLMTTGDALRDAARRHPQRIALVEVVPPGLPSLTGASDTARRWTYAELLAQAEQCAHWLLTRFAPGERVCLWAPNVPEWVILQYGVALAGLVLVTANPALRSIELRYVLRQSRCTGLLYTAEFRGTDMAAVAREVAGEVRETFCLLNWQTEVRTHSDRGELPHVQALDPAQIQYTSGTTGNPKGALLHHAGLVTSARLTCNRAGIEASVVISPMPLFHTAGAVLSSLGCVTTGSTYVLPLLFEPETLMRAIALERCDVLYGVPTMQIAMLDHPKRDQYDLSTLRVAISGGAPVPPELLHRIETGFHCDLLTLYGQTECSPTISMVGPNDNQEDKATTVGQPLPQVEIRIADPASGKTQPVGAEGEVEVRGPQCMLGYFEMPEETAQTMRPDGWLRTGDLGTLDRRGYLRVTGRLKDMIIRGGENIYPAEVEARLMEHATVAMAVVFGIPDARWGEVVGAAVQIRAGMPLPAAETLRAHCLSMLAPQKLPTVWFSCDAFPLTASGKVQKFRLRELAEKNQLTQMV
ncbi:AMP-binding protein [Variovorax paradoxus]|uniref:AMP-binding protein n=1 Tax=Variovorax paradoxus TaxID=34073 RepID=UPI003ECF9FC6